MLGHEWFSDGFHKRVLDIGFKYHRASFNWVKRTDGKQRRLRVIRNHCGFAFIRLSIESPPWDTLTTYTAHPPCHGRRRRRLCVSIFMARCILHMNLRISSAVVHVFNIKCIALIIIDSIRSIKREKARRARTSRCFIFS